MPWELLLSLLLASQAATITPTPCPWTRVAQAPLAAMTENRYRDLHSQAQRLARDFTQGPHPAIFVEGLSFTSSGKKGTLTGQLRGSVYPDGSVVLEVSVAGAIQPAAKLTLLPQPKQGLEIVFMGTEESFRERGAQKELFRRAWELFPETRYLTCELAFTNAAQYQSNLEKGLRPAQAAEETPMNFLVRDRFELVPAHSDFEAGARLQPHLYFRRRAAP